MAHSFTFFNSWVKFHFIERFPDQAITANSCPTLTYVGTFSPSFFLHNVSPHFIFLLSTHHNLTHYVIYLFIHSFIHSVYYWSLPSRISGPWKSRFLFICWCIFSTYSNVVTRLILNKYLPNEQMLIKSLQWPDTWYILNISIQFVF